jgi:uncharacterized membrane protein
MKPKAFLDLLDEDKIVKAIAEAERRSSGEVRVYVSHESAKDVMAAAQHQFVKLGMRKTEARNGVLIFFAPAIRQFAIVGDSGIHEKCGDAFWQETSRDLSHRLKQGDFTDAIIEAVRKVGDLLVQHFPPRHDDNDELPNAIEGD